jgi:hypothetical protein
MSTKDHSVDDATQTLHDDILAELKQHGEVCLDDLQLSSSRKETARTTLSELASKDYLASVDGKPDTWELGERSELLLEA